MSSEYRSFKGCIYRLDVDKEGAFCKASKLLHGEWISLELTLRAMLLIDADGIPLSLEQALNSEVKTVEMEEK